MARRDGPDIGRQEPQPRSCPRLGLFTVGSAGSIFSQLRLVCMPRWLNTFDCELPTMRQLVVCAALLLVFQLRAHAETLLPSQEEQGLVTIKTCRNHEVLSSLKTAIDRTLQTESVLARGMRASDIYLEAVWIEPPAVTCSTTVAAKGTRERIIYTVALDAASYVIKFGGEPGGSKLFPYQLEVRPINMDMPPGCSGPMATRPQRCVDTTTQASGHLQY